MFQEASAHAYQYQRFGIFTIPLIIGSSISNDGLLAWSGGGGFPSFMGRSSFEKAVDDYAQGLINEKKLREMNVLK